MRDGSNSQGFEPSNAPAVFCNFKTMTTKDFIANNIGKIPSSKKWCSSVYQDTDGNFFSYGSHYPLLFKVKGQWVVNNAGYSNSTSKHINWAWSAIGYDNALGVPLQRSDMSLENVIDSLDKAKTQLFGEIERGRDGSRIQESRKESAKEMTEKLKTFLALNK